MLLSQVNRVEYLQISMINTWKTVILPQRLQYRFLLRIKHLQAKHNISQGEMAISQSIHLAWECPVDKTT